MYQKWDNQDLSYWTSLNLKTDYTQKPYYDTYLYKLSFICSGITRWKNRIEAFSELKEKYISMQDRPTWAFWSMDRIIPPDECLHVIVELARLHRKYKSKIRVRTEHHWGSIYTNDPTILNEFLSNTSQYFNSKEWMLGLDKIYMPSPRVAYDNKNIVYKRKLPYDKFKYKVIISGCKKSDYYNRSVAWLEWAMHMDDIQIPLNAIDSITNKRFAYGVIYFYCIEETTLQMSQFLLGDSIKTIQQFELFDK